MLHLPFLEKIGPYRQVGDLHSQPVGLRPQLLGHGDGILCLFKGRIGEFNGIKAQLLSLADTLQVGQLACLDILMKAINSYGIFHLISTSWPVAADS